MRNVRTEVERRLGGPLAEPEWEFLDDQGYVADVEVGARDVDGLVALTRDARHAFRGPRPASDETEQITVDRPGDESVTERVNALSAIYAAWAAGDSGVTSFRSRNLRDWQDPTYRDWLQGDRRGPRPKVKVLLLKDEEVLAWITRAHHARLATGDGDAHVEELLRRGGSTETLDYIVEQQVRRLTVDAGGPLGDLAKLAGRLARLFRWHPAEATMFVLTGSQPQVLILAASAEIRALDARTRVTLTLDPMLTPQQVAEFYADVRAQITPGRPPRHLSAKHYRLARHVGPRVGIRVLPRVQVSGPGRRPGTTSTARVTTVMPVPPHTWAGFYAEWQQTAPRAWRYSQRSNFQRDARAALFRLLFTGWEHPG